MGTKRAKTEALVLSDCDSDGIPSSEVPSDHSSAVPSDEDTPASDAVPSDDDSPTEAPHLSVSSGGWEVEGALTMLSASSDG